MPQALLEGFPMGRLAAAILVAPLFALMASAGDVPLADLNAGLGNAENGTIVRVRGVIDACRPDSCFICPDWDKAAREDDIFRRPGCLSLISWKDANAGLLLDEVYRFSDVEITGRFQFK